MCWCPYSDQVAATAVRVVAPGTKRVRQPARVSATLMRTSPPAPLVAKPPTSSNALRR